ncbi:MAG TPA: sortase, partial [Rubrobacter sp.]|nr:sortase [Rubrobacter sp.]
TSTKKDTKSDDGKKQTNSNDSKKQTNSNDSKKQTNSDNAKKQTNSNHSGTQKKTKHVETLNYRGKKLQIENRSTEPRQGNSGTSSKSTTAQEKPPNWPAPSPEETAAADQIRRFAPNPDSRMTLSVRALGIYDAPITDFDRPDKLNNGLVRVPETSRVDDPGTQKNVYVAGHYLGYDRTPSRLIFYNLHNLKKGDKLTVKDSLGRIYNYQVSEKFAVSPNDKWVMGQVRGRDMLTLQTCIPPDFGQRLVVRADRVKNT